MANRFKSSTMQIRKTLDPRMSRVLDNMKEPSILVTLD